jgi:N4-gp56 family major capsid protein
MAISTAAYPGGTASIVTSTRLDKFIPELWSDEVIAAFKKKLVMGNLVRKMPFTGKKGDTMHIPMPTRGSVYAKAAGTAVTIQANVESEITVVVNKHYEYSRFIEDFAAVQALNSARQFYTGDAGYQLAKQIDSDLIRLGRVAFAGTDGGAAGEDPYAAGVIGGDGITSYTSASTGNASAISDAGIRRVIQTLDDNDIPMEDRHLVIPPSSRNTLMGLARFTEQAFVGESAKGNTIRNGQIGNVYGVDVYVTTNCDTASVASGTDNRVALFFHESAMILAMQQNIRSQTQYKQEYLATLYTGDVIYGVKGILTSATAGAENAAGMIAMVVPA